MIFSAFQCCCVWTYCTLQGLSVDNCAYSRLVLSAYAVAKKPTLFYHMRWHHHMDGDSGKGTSPEHGLGHNERTQWLEILTLVYHFGRLVFEALSSSASTGSQWGCRRHRGNVCSWAGPQPGDGPRQRQLQLRWASLHHDQPAQVRR